MWFPPYSEAHSRPLTATKASVQEFSSWNSILTTLARCEHCLVGISHFWAILLDFKLLKRVKLRYRTTTRTELDTGLMFVSRLETLLKSSASHSTPMRESFCVHSKMLYRWEIFTFRILTSFTRYELVEATQKLFSRVSSSTLFWKWKSLLHCFCMLHTHRCSSVAWWMLRIM